MHSISRMTKTSEKETEETVSDVPFVIKYCIQQLNAIYADIQTLITKIITHVYNCSSAEKNEVSFHCLKASTFARLILS